MPLRSIKDFGWLVPITTTVNISDSSLIQPFLNFVRVEFNGIVLGDSHKLEVPVDECMNYNFTCSFECSDVGYTLDDLAHKPIILTVIEVLPKEKKQKEEKTSVLGQAIVDLLPLLRGQWSFSSTVVLHPAPGSPSEISLQDEGIKPTLEVTVSVPEPLLSDSQLSESNLLAVTVETAYSVPDVWNLALGPSCSYVAALQVPLTAEKEQILLFSNGVLKMGGEREPVPRPKKWPISPLLAPDAQFIPGNCIEGELTDLEDGDLTSIEDQEFRAEAECNRKRVSWDTERRCFVDAGGAACLTRRIAECRLWPVEVMRSPQAGAAKVAVGKASKEKTQAEDEIQLPFHGVAYVDLAPLLYPGAKCVRGAYVLHPFYDSDLLLKTKRKMSVLWESMKAPAAQGRPRPPSSVGSCKAAPSKVFETLKEVIIDILCLQTGKLDQCESITDAEPQVNAEGQMYADSRSYIVIEIALEKPLVPKRPPEELAKRVMELIPPRPPLPQRPAGAERAVQDYQAQIASVGAQVLEQYQQMFGDLFVPGAKPLDSATEEQRKRQLLGELNYSGKYFAFKEQIKYSVVRIVREKMLRTEAFTDAEQLQVFLSQLYVFLVDEMHAALNKTLSADAPEVQPEPLLDCSQLRHFAKEALLNEEYQLAAQYYQEQLARDRSNPSHWFDYGVFYMLTADYLKAEECFQLAVFIKQVNVPSLLMCGILSEMSGRYEDAETFFERATCIEPSCVVAWTLFGLFYLAQENLIRAEMAFGEATKQLRTAVVCSPGCRQETVYDNQTPTEGGRQEEVKFRQSLANPVDKHGELLISHTKLVSHAFMAQRALAQQLLCPDGGPSSSYHLALAHVKLLQGQYSSAKASLQESLNDSFQNPDAWALYGHLKYLTKDYNQAQKCYERTLDFVTDASDTHTVYLRLGSIYLQSREYEKAKTTYLRACRSTPSCLTWLGLGIACYRLGELTEAEDALSEANTLNNRNPKVWGYLALVCLQTGRKLEAEQSYKYALKVNEPLLQEIRELQDRVGFGNPSFP
uniref:Cilia and flagella associated protein 70 n=1 Tax=Pygocentrus nattereri TaxID=42514 RepID=A0AAR2L6Z2_PYGNA